VRALIDWRKASGFCEGPIFRQITKAAKVMELAIGAHTWNRLIGELAEAAGLPNGDLPKRFWSISKRGASLVIVPLTCFLSFKGSRASGSKGTVPI